MIPQFCGPLRRTCFVLLLPCFTTRNWPSTCSRRHYGRTAERRFCRPSVISCRRVSCPVCTPAPFRRNHNRRIISRYPEITRPILLFHPATRPDISSGAKRYLVMRRQLRQCRHRYRSTLPLPSITAPHTYTPSNNNSPQKPQMMALTDNPAGTLTIRQMRKWLHKTCGGLFIWAPQSLLRNCSSRHFSTIFPKNLRIQECRHVWIEKEHWRNLDNLMFPQLPCRPSRRLICRTANHQLAGSARPLLRAWQLNARIPCHSSSSRRCLWFRSLLPPRETCRHQLTRLIGNQCVRVCRPRQIQMK